MGKAARRRGRGRVQTTQGTLLLAVDYIRDEVSMALASGRLQEGAVVSKEHRGRRGREQTMLFSVTGIRTPSVEPASTRPSLSWGAQA